MSTHHSGSMPPSAVQGYPSQLLLLSDDLALTQLVQSLIAVSRYGIECLCLPSSQFRPEQSLTADLILLDRHYGGRSPQWSLEAINHTCKALGVEPPRKILLCDPQLLQQDLEQLASLAKLGIDEFLSKSQLCFERLLPPPINSPVGAVNFHAARAQTSAVSNVPPLQNEPRQESAGGPVGAPGFLENIAQEPALQSDHQNWNPHNLYLDIENQWLRIDVNHADWLFEKNLQLPLDDWKKKLTGDSASAIDNTLDKAVNYHKLPDTVPLVFNRGASDSYETGGISAQLVNIRIENNGQGRVVALNATLLVAKEFDSEQAASVAASIANTSTVPVTEVSESNIARSLPMACLILDANGVIQSIVSDALFRSGQLPSPQIGEDLQSLLGSSDESVLREEIKRCLNTGQNYNATISHSTDSGLRWFETQVNKIRGGTGLDRQVIWTAFDVSESRESYMELSKKEGNLSQILSNAPFLFFEKDNNGHYRRANQAFCSLLAVEESAIIGRRDKDLFAEELCVYLQSLEEFIRNNQDNEAVFDAPVPANIRENFGSIYWRSRAMKYRFSEGVESLLAFGISLKQAAAEQDPQPAPVSGVADLTLKMDKANALNSTPASFQGSGSLKQDFKAMLASLVNYTEMAVSQKNELRNRKLVEQLESLEATVARAKTLIASGGAGAEQPGNVEELRPCELQILTEEIVRMQMPTLPATLDFKTNLLCEEQRALARPEDYQKIVLQLISSARDTAIKRQAATANSNAAAQDSSLAAHISSIELTLLPVTVDTVCSACDERISGDFLELAVHTNEYGFGGDDLKALIKQAKIAVQRAIDSGGQTNVMALTHLQEGHALIEHHKGRLSLKLLFKKDLSG